MNNSQKEALFGTTASHAEHREGDVVLVRRGADIRAGTILHIRAPGPAIQGGTDHPLLYMVDTNEGLPIAVKSSEIIEGSFTACIGSYGYPDSDLTREQAENMAWHLDTRRNYCMDTDKGRLRVLTARIEGDERQGRVIAECEAVVESEQKGE